MADPTKVCATVSNTLPNCANIPGWLAPAVIIAGIGLIITTLFNIINNRRATVKEKREKIINPLLEEFSTRISNPVTAALQDFEDVATTCQISFRQFRTDTGEGATLRRVAFAKTFQQDTFEPARFKIVGALQRADQYAKTSTGGKWTDLQDKYDHLDDIMNELQSDSALDVDRLDRLTGKFSSTINNASTDINNELHSYKTTLSNKNKIYFYGLRLSKE